MNHLSEQALRDLCTGAFDAARRCEALEHLAQCGDCMERFDAASQAALQVDPPAGLQESVLCKLCKIEPEPLKRQESFRQYTLRVIASVAATLILLFTGAFSSITKITPTEIHRQTAQVSRLLEMKFEQSELAAFIEKLSLEENAYASKTQ
ncbi:MAG: hypothetical protein LBB67_03895 [Oscillospiraceae bacterium]|jgi:hypothetical protein|nr:hypothetical protein [Oscillospiraceae bacterium]